MAALALPPRAHRASRSAPAWRATSAAAPATRRSTAPSREARRPSAVSRQRRPEPQREDRAVELTLHEPRTLRDALRLLRDEGPLVPLAGCTDVYRALQLRRRCRGDALPRPLAARRRCAASATRGRPARRSARSRPTPTSSARALVRRRLPMLVAAAREVGGPQIQNRGTHRRQRRERLARGRHAAGARGRRRGAGAARARTASGACRSREFYTGYRASVLRAGRADRRRRGAAASRARSGSGRWARARRRRSRRS